MLWFIPHPPSPSPTNLLRFHSLIIIPSLFWTFKHPFSLDFSLAYKYIWISFILKNKTEKLPFPVITFHRYWLVAPVKRKIVSFLHLTIILLVFSLWQQDEREFSPKEVWTTVHLAMELGCRSQKKSHVIYLKIYLGLGYVPLSFLVRDFLLPYSMS